MVNPRQVLSRFNRAQKLVVLVVVMALVALLAFGGWYMWQKNAVPSGWVKFEDQNYGFKFNYPRAWGTAKLSTIDEKTGKTFTINIARAQMDKDFPSSVSIELETASIIRTGCKSDTHDAQ